MNIRADEKSAQPPLGARASAGIKWSSFSQVGRQAMQFATTAVLAHLLSSSDFGLVSMSAVFTGFLALFKDMGTSAAVIQAKNQSEELLSSIFWANVALGLFLTCLLYFSAPFIALFFHEPRIAFITEMLSATFFFSSIYTVQHSLLIRGMRFNELARVELWATLFASVAGIGSALLGAGVLSLVYQSLTNTVCTLVFIMRASRWKPRFIFRPNELRAVLGYSLNLTGFNVFNYFARNADNLLIGRFLGARNLGYYTLAYNLLLYPLSSVSDVVARVMFPVYSRVQDDNRRFREMYLRVAGAIALITFPMMLGLMSASRAFVLSFYGAKWEPVIVLLLIFAPVGLAQSLLTSVGLIYQAKGKTDWMFRWGIVSGVAAVLSFVAGLPFGIIGVSVAYAVACGILLYPGFKIPGKLIELSFKDVAGAVSGIFQCSAAMALGVWLLSYVLPRGWPAWSCLAVEVPFGVILYWSLIHLFDLKAYRDVRQLITRELGVS